MTTLVPLLVALPLLGAAVTLVFGRNARLQVFVTVATLEVAPQISWEHGVTDHTDDALSYSVWHGVVDHQPLGGVNRVRKETYELSAGFRGTFNGCPMHQPKTLAELA